MEAIMHGAGVLEVYEYRYAAEAYADPWTVIPSGVEPPPQELRRARRILVREAGAWIVAEVRAASYYKLAPTRPGSPPTLEIDGIHMHRIVDTDPLSDARAKAAAARIGRGHRVLDVCTGLGYTAIAALERGARLVHSIEVDENVLWLAERNPWSRRLSDDRVIIILGDAADVIHNLPSGLYDRAIHDPPRFTGKTSHLYSLDLYNGLYRVLRPGGILYHYTGEPGRLRGFTLPSRVARLLREAGFEEVTWLPRVQGLRARKPRR